MAARRATSLVVCWIPMLGAGLDPPAKDFERVDQGVEDRGALSASYRDIGIDLRTPMHFDTVYRVDPRARLLRGVRGSRSGMYARAHGALVAVFPKSAYREIAPGIDMVQVPPGTVYTLGDASAMSHVERESLPRDERPSSRLLSVPIVTRIGDASAAPINQAIDGRIEDRAAPKVGPASIWTDDMYRRQRVVGLLDRALRESGADETR